MAGLLCDHCGTFPEASVMGVQSLFAGARSVWCVYALDFDDDWLYNKEMKPCNADDDHKVVGVDFIGSQCN